MQRQKQRSKGRFPRKRVIVGCVVTFLFGCIGLAQILSMDHIIDMIWSNIFSIVFGILAILVPFWQTLFPVSSSPASPSPVQPVSPPVPSLSSSSTSVASTTPASTSGTQQNVSQIPTAAPPMATLASPVSSLPAIFYVNTPHLPASDELYGRKRERVTLLDSVRRGLPVSIVGPRRIGKTWLIDYLKLEMFSQSANSFHFATLDGTMPQCQTVTEFCTNVFKAFGVPYTSADVDMAMLGTFVREQRVRQIFPVLCIDEFEGLFNKQAFDYEFFTQLRYVAQNDGLVLVTSSRSPLIDLVGEHCKTSPFFNIFNPIILKPFTRTEAEDFAQKKSAQAGWNDDERAALLTYGQERGRQRNWPPLRLQMAGQMLLEDKHLAILGEPDSYRPTEAAYWRAFEQRLEEKYRGVVRR